MVETYNPLQARFNASDNSPPAIVHLPGLYLIGRKEDSSEVSVRMMVGGVQIDHLDLEQFNWLLRGQTIGYDLSVSREHADFTLEAEGVRFNHTGRFPTSYIGEHGSYDIQSKLLLPGRHQLQLRNMPLTVTVEPYSRDMIESLPGFPRKEKPKNILSRIWDDVLRGIRDA